MWGNAEEGERAGTKYEVRSTDGGWLFLADS